MKNKENTRILVSGKSFPGASTGRLKRLLEMACWLLFFFSLPIILSCSLRITKPDRFPEAVRLHDVSPYRQEPEQCGPYALAAVQNYLGVRADPEEMGGRLYSPGAKGTLTLDLYLEAARSGLAADQVNGTPAAMRESLDSAPVIALFRYPALAGSGGHFVVVTGYSLVKRGFFLLWGDGRLSWMDEKMFEQLWSGSGRWMLVVQVEPAL